MQITVDVNNLDSAKEISSAIVKRINEMPDDEFRNLARRSIYNAESIVSGAIDKRATELVNSITEPYGENSLMNLVKELLMAEVIKPAIDSMRESGKYSEPVLESVVNDVFPHLFTNTLYDYIMETISHANARRNNDMAAFVSSSINRAFNR